MIEEVQCITCKHEGYYRVMLIKVSTMEEFACFDSPKEQWDSINNVYQYIIEHYCHNFGILKYHLEFYYMNDDNERYKGIDND
jgi:hypothetical protein